MEDYHYRIVKLMEKYLCQKISKEEKKELEAWEEKTPTDLQLHTLFDAEELRKRESFFQEIDLPSAFRRFEKRIRHKPSSRKTYRKILRYAAFFILPLTCGILMLKTEPVSSPEETPIQPGSYQAILTLSDGHHLPLSENIPQELPLPASVHITGTGKEIIYNNAPDTTLSTLYNRLSTPRGGEYQIILSDSSRIYLNAATELKYPVVFNSSSREVYLSGEAYFEIAKDSLRPFYVVTDAARVRVYGTKFNINTHHNRTQAVLVEGHIGIQGKSEEREYHLQPSDLSTFTPDGRLIDIRQVDTFPYIAWKSGKFVFENKCLEEIMDHLALWYDVDIFYMQPSLKTLRFTGHMRKYDQIGTIFDAIHRITGVKFRIEGKTITVMQ